jgi:hypothetical protein
LVAVLETNAIGCGWLRDRWAALGQILDAGRRWRPLDRLRAIRLLGQQPGDAADDPRVRAIYLACRAMDPEGPDVFAEVLGELEGPEAAAARERLAARFAAAGAERGPDDAAGARAELRALAAAGAARAEALREVRTADEAAERADVAGRLSDDSERALEWVRKQQASCSRALYRAVEELRKLRRDFGDDWAADQPAGGPADPGPGAGAAPAPEPCEAPRAAAPACGPCESTHGPEARAAREADAAPASSRWDVVEPDDLAPTVAAEPVGDRDARTVTNEASSPADPFGRRAAEPAGEVAIGPVTPTEAEPSDANRPGQPDEGAGRPGPRPADEAPVVTNEAKGPVDEARDAANEANEPADEPDRTARSLPASVLTLLALFITACFWAAVAVGAGHEKNPPPIPISTPGDTPSGRWMHPAPAPEATADLRNVSWFPAVFSPSVARLAPIRA